MDVTFGFGNACPKSALESITDADLKSVIFKNWYFANSEMFVYQFGVIKHIWKNKYDVLIAEYNPRILSNVLLAMKIRPKKTKLILWGHGLGKKYKSNYFATRLRLKLANMANALILYSKEGANIFKNYGYPEDRIFIAQNTIDATEILKKSKTYDFKKRFRILYTGRLIASKKLYILIKAFALAIANIDQTIRLTIIGDGPEKNNLLKLSQNLGLENRIDFLGRVYDVETLANYYNTTLISVSPGYIGLQAIQSIAFGVPVAVARDEKHSPEISALDDGVNSIYFPSDDIRTLSEIIIKSSRDYKTMISMSNAAKLIASKCYDQSNMIKAFEMVVSRVLENNE